MFHSKVNHAPTRRTDTILMDGPWITHFMSKDKHQNENENISILSFDLIALSSIRSEFYFMHTHVLPSAGYDFAHT